MRTCTSVFFCFIFLSSTLLLSQNIKWIKTSGGTGDDVNIFNKIDASGNIYFCGYFSNTVDFDPSSGIDTKVSNGSSDVFISKFDSYGNYIWTLTFGSTTSDLARAIDFDSLGNIYVTGYISGNTDFDPSAATNLKSGLGGPDFFIASYDFSGKLRWANVFGNFGNDQGYSIELDNSGDLCVTGFYQGQVDFDPTGSTTNLISQNLNDGFIAKYTTSGSLKWAISIGGNSADHGSFVTIDKNNNLYVSGDYYSSNFDLDPSVTNSTNLSSNGGYDAFIAKYSSTGTYIWSRTFSSITDDFCVTMGIDNFDNIFISNSFTNPVTFSGNNLVVNPISTISSYLTSYDSNGSMRWTKVIPGINPFNFVLVNSKNLYISGQFSGTSDLNPNSGIDIFNSSGGLDAYISKYDTDGNYYWSKTLGGSGDEMIHNLTNKNDLIYAAGYFNADFNLIAKSLTTSGLNDLMSLKITDNSFISNYQTITVISPPITITSPPITVTSLNIVTVTVYNIILIDNNNNTITGTNYRLENQSISIYPNPSNGNFTIETKNIDVQKIEIYNSLGTRLFESFQKTIEMKDFSTGIYFIKLFDRDNKLIEIRKMLIE